jgi:lipoate-protein ligase A
MFDQSANRSTWRLIIHGPAPGAWNMAVDEAMAEATAAGYAPPTLRFYAWSPPCLSLGRHQPLHEVDVERCRLHGVDIVRRPTGGRAILHTDELTYSVVAPPSEALVAGAVMDAYHRISEGLVAGLRLLGVPAEEAPGSSRAGPDVSAACFEVPSAYEITAKGRKLMGSAQSRRVDWVLQHGSLPLYGDVTRIVDYLTLDSEEARHALRETLRMRATTVEAVLGYRLGFNEAAEAMARGFAQALPVILTRGELSGEEIAAAERLVAEKYGAEAWTARPHRGLAQRAA